LPPSSSDELLEEDDDEELDEEEVDEDEEDEDELSLPSFSLDELLDTLAPPLAVVAPSRLVSGIFGGFEAAAAVDFWLRDRGLLGLDVVEVAAVEDTAGAVAADLTAPPFAGPLSLLALAAASFFFAGLLAGAFFLGAAVPALDPLVMLALLAGAGANEDASGFLRLLRFLADCSLERVGSPMALERDASAAFDRASIILSFFSGGCRASSALVVSNRGAALALVHPAAVSMTECTHASSCLRFSSCRRTSSADRRTVAN
jgi:hypothetical protein